jgi:hypothetical protein
MDIVNKIIQGDTIKSVSIVRIGDKANEFKPNTESFLKMVEDAKTKLKASIEKKAKLEDEWTKKNIPVRPKKSGLKYSILKKELIENLRRRNCKNPLFGKSFD